MLAHTITADKPALAVNNRPSDQLYFATPTDADIPRIARILSRSASRTCDYTLGGMMMWVQRFAYTVCIIDDTLFVKGVLENDPTVAAFSLPVGKMPMPRAISLVQRYCHSHGITPVFSAIPEDRITEFTDVNPGAAIEELADWFDYLYDIHTMAYMHGKKMNKKRNHINRFVANNPFFVVEDIDDVPAGELLELANDAGKTEVDDAPGAICADMAAYELSQCRRVIRMPGHMGMRGIALRTSQDTPPVAMALGEVVGDTLFVHIEKIRHDVEGAGEMLNMHMARHMLELFPGLRYVNLEEDVADPGLRRSKESYHPVQLLHKYNISL